MYKEEYCEYLKGRSSVSILYKKMMVYPRLLSKAKGKILDYGCGIGDLLSYNKAIIGVDINEYCIESCVERGLNAMHIENNKLPFQDNELSTIILDNVYEHLPHPEDQFVEIRRVLKTDGRLIIGVPGLKGHHLDSTHIRYYSEELLVDSLDRQHFKLDHLFYTPFIKSKYLSKKLNIYVLWGVFSPRTAI